MRPFAPRHRHTHSALVALPVTLAACGAELSEPPAPPHPIAMTEASDPAVQIVRLAVADASRYRELMLHAYTVAADAFTSTPEERAAEPDTWWAARIANARGLSQTFGALLQGRLVGVVTIEFADKPKTRHKALLIGMFVAETARGLGLGRRLVGAALDAARSRPGICSVTLTATEGNTPAIALYESCGFRCFGVEPMAIATPSGFKSKVHMWLELPTSAAQP